MIPLHVPPLRERAEDVPMLAAHFLRRHSEAMGRPGLRLSGEALSALAAYAWPGNVRELSNVIERAAALCAGDSIELADLPPAVQRFTPEAPSQTLPDGGIDLERIIEDLERGYVQQALERARYSHKRAAELLGLTPRSFRYRLQKYNLDTE